MAIKPQPIDDRMRKAGEMLALLPEQIAVQHGLIGPDMLYAWAKPLGETVLVNSELRAQKFEPGVLLQEALATFRR